jgi:hypothetical protein
MSHEAPNVARGPSFETRAKRAPQDEVYFVEASLNTNAAIASINCAFSARSG